MLVSIDGFLYLCRTMSSKDIIQGIKQIALQVLPDGADAILFGSRARGDARPDSDYDFLISKGQVRTLFLHAALCQALEDALCAPVDLITDTSSDTALIEQARKDAVLLYERQRPDDRS